MNDDRPETLSVTDPQPADGRRAYEAPKLVRLGSVRDLTLGGSGKRTDVGTRTRK